MRKRTGTVVLSLVRHPGRVREAQHQKARREKGHYREIAVRSGATCPVRSAFRQGHGKRPVVRFGALCCFVPVPPRSKENPGQFSLNRHPLRAPRRVFLCDGAFSPFFWGISRRYFILYLLDLACLWGISPFLVGHLPFLLFGPFWAILQVPVFHRFILFLSYVVFGIEIALYIE